MNPAELTHIADQAADKSDRWLMVMLLIIILVGMYCLVRYLFTQNGKVMQDHAAAREAYHKSLSEMVAAGHETSKHLAVCLDRNTTAIGECTVQLRRCQEDRN